MGQRVADILSLVWNHPANREAKLRATLRALVWQLYKRATGGTVDVTLPSGMRLRVHPGSAVGGLAVYCSGRADFDETAFLEVYLRPGDTFLDVGANVGLYTLLAAGWTGPKGRVVAFEPSSDSRGRLAENVALNHLEQRVQIVGSAVGSETGTVRFVTGQDCQNRIHTDLDHGAYEELPCVRLDEALAGERIALAKMDVEGAEALALRGATELLKQANPPVWLLEVNDSLKKYGADAQGLVTWLDRIGYDLGTYSAETRTVDLRPNAWRGSQNAFAIARARQTELTQRIPGLTFAAEATALRRAA